ncbi:uncharacterized protein LOC141640347 isoform X2 [Silene latifolia]|uniref:uncharacterized protein LOC141640347 isoform X2 n=1 Tax=Silene latifolia TaxID=37657 RepID=UPI003D779FEC
MGKKQMARRTPQKKTMEDEKKARGKQTMQKGKEKVKTGVSFREAMETDEREDSDASEDISEDTEDSGEEGSTANGACTKMVPVKEKPTFGVTLASSNGRRIECGSSPVSAESASAKCSGRRNG